jgi:hypothetical protein
MMTELHSGVLAKVALTPTRIASDTTTTGSIVDTLGFESCEFIVQFGTLTTAGATFTITVQGDDTVGFGSPVAVAAAVLLGSFPVVVGTEDNTLRKVGVKLPTIAGSDRFLRLSIVSAGTAAAAHDLSALCMLGRASKTPITQPTS